MARTCDVCEVEMKERLATAQQPYIYTLVGLRGVALAGIRVFRCPRCKTESPLIPRIGELHRVIAQHLVRKSGLLTGEELRFLRKNAGFPAVKFAALLGVDPAHLSRVEHGKMNLGTSTDKLARAVVTAAAEGEDVRDVLLKFADETHQVGMKRKPLFKMEKNRWKAAA
jgi:putative transcriptional regulator